MSQHTLYLHLPDMESHKLLSDKGLQFNGQDFKQFAGDYGFRHTTCSHGYS